MARQLFVQKSANVRMTNTSRCTTAGTPISRADEHLSWIRLDVVLTASMDFWTVSTACFRLPSTGLAASLHHQDRYLLDRRQARVPCNPSCPATHL